MNTRTFLIIIGVSAVVLVAVFLLIANQKKQTAPVVPPAETSMPKQSGPTPTPISKPVPVVTRTLRGIATSVNNNSLVLTVAGKGETLNLSTINDVYRLTGGTIDGGNAKTEPAKVTDVKTGQELWVIADKSSPDVQRIVILK